MEAMNELTNVPYDLPGNPSTNTSVTINGEQINYQLVDSLTKGSSPLNVEVDNPENQDEVRQAIVDRLQSQHWFLSPEYATQILRQRFEVELAEGVSVGVYNFQERDLLPEELSTLGKTLARYYQSLKDKSLWTLDSIQIEKVDVRNPKSGEPYRGMEVPAQRRFKLFPASFAEGRYRDIIDCSWLEGSIDHETTHVTVEPALRTLWEQQAEALGWREAEDALIELPGGFTTTRYNEFPSRCATAYGSYQQDDDRAESIVQHLVEPSKLDGTRARIVSQLFDMPNPQGNQPMIVQRPAELPKLGVVSVSAAKKPVTTGFFVGKGVVRQGTPKPTVNLQTFRQQHGIA